MNILITGGAGFIGSNIADRYIKEGHKVIIVDDFWSGRKVNIPKNAVFYELDIRNPELENICLDHKIDFINHQAARGDVRQSLLIPGEYADVNIIGGINLLEIARKQKMKGIIYSSTGGCVYGEPQYVPTDEEHAMQPLDPYGASKSCFEIYLSAYHKLYGLNFVIFRYANIYGPRQNPFGEAGVVSIFTSLMLKNEKVIINGDGKQKRDYLYIDDVVRANLLALEKIDNQIYNLGTSIATDVNEIFDNIKLITQYNHAPSYGPPKDGEVSRSTLSFKKIKDSWGWYPETDLITGLKSTVNHISRKEV